MLKITHIHSRNIYQGIQLYGPLIKLKIITVSLVKFLSFLATQEGWKVEVRQGNQSLEIHPQKKKFSSNVPQILPFPFLLGTTEGKKNNGEYL